MKTLIKGGSVYLGGSFQNKDILIEDGIISEIEAGITIKTDSVIDASGLTVMPGLIDMHVHLREPGYEYKEDIVSGTKAAAAGGFTAVACMPNTNPVIDDESTVSYVVDRAKKAGYARVYPIGAITKGEKGEELSEMYKMKKAGIVAVSDDGRPVENANIMRHALEYAKTVDLLLISHSEDLELSKGGAVNEGYHSTISGLPGISRVAEESIVAREILLAEALGCRVHIAHISTKGSAELVRQGKRRGIKVTAETCPHYFAATDELILSYDSFTKVNPPLRTEEDRLAIIEAIKDGTVDAIVTDHAPHHLDEKKVEYVMAANGISGLETSFSLAYTYLVKSGAITLEKLIELMSTSPAKLIGVPSGIAVGAPADIAIADLSAEYNIDTAKFYSKGKNTPFNGWKVKGKIDTTILGGKVVYSKGKIV
jgi:dihydroorotase